MAYAIGGWGVIVGVSVGGALGVADAEGVKTTTGVEVGVGGLSAGGRHPASPMANARTAIQTLGLIISSYNNNNFGVKMTLCSTSFYNNPALHV
jgi:hypothetical protein